MFKGKLGIDFKRIDKKLIYLMFFIVALILLTKTLYLSTVSQRTTAAKVEFENSKKELVATTQQINDYKTLGSSSVDDIATQLVQLEGFLPKDVDDLLFNQYLAQTASANKVLFSAPNIEKTVPGETIQYKIYTFTVNGNYSDVNAFISSILSHPQYYITVADSVVTFSSTNQFTSKVSINLSIRVWLSSNDPVISEGENSKSTGLASDK